MRGYGVNTAVETPSTSDYGGQLWVLAPDADAALRTARADLEKRGYVLKRPLHQTCFEVTNEFSEDEAQRWVAERKALRARA